MSKKQWYQSPLMQLLNIDIPLIQAPMAGGATTPELVANVCNAGGLGSIGAGYMSLKLLSQSIDQVRALTDNNFSVNLFVPEACQATIEQQKIMVQHINNICSTELAIKVEPVTPPFLPDFDEQLQVVIDKKIPIVSFTFGIPEKRWLEELKQRNIITLGTATSLDEAVALQQAGVDAIVAQSAEAGGHRGTFIGIAENSLFSQSVLVPLLVKHIDVPIIAAGGIMNGQAILKALSLGAYGVQLGTAFLSCPEAGIHEEYKKELLKQTEDKTRLTKTFSGKLARGIGNKFIEAMAPLENNCLDYPIQNALTKPMRQAAAKQDNSAFMSLWAGQSVYLSRGISAQELINQLTLEILR